MTLLNTINVGGTDYGITGAAILGSCATPAGSEIKVCTFTDNFELKAGDMLLVKFTYANTYGDGSTTYPKLQVNGTNYVMRRADGNYLQSGEWGNNATLTFLFDGTDFILPAGSGSAKGSGVPLGAILAIHSNQVPDGYLPCNGVQFDTAQFAALYALLGDDHTPDLREVTLVGIGQNATDTIATHDVYTLGEFKDDQLQNHEHGLTLVGINDSASALKGVTSYTGTNANTSPAQSVSGGAYGNIRFGSTTHGKQKGVNYIIKATSGLPDDQQDYILNTINEQRSYSTTEHPTGKKWIDGKDIWSATVDCGALPNATSKTVSHGITNIDRITKVECNSSTSAGLTIPIPYAPLDILGNGVGLSVDKTTVYLGTGVDRSNFTSTYCTLEYTKTTPST